NDRHHRNGRAAVRGRTRQVPLGRPDRGRCHECLRLPERPHQQLDLTGEMSADTYVAHLKWNASIKQKTKGKIVNKVKWSQSYSTDSPMVVIRGGATG